MSNDDMTVAVVIPLYNHEHYIKEALDSVADQTVPVDEIIVVDDGSQDNGAAVARECLNDHKAAQIIEQANAGAHAAINRAISLTSSTHIAILNSDDRFKPNKIERVKTLFREQPELDLTFGRVALIDGASAPVIRGETVDWLARSLDFLDRSKNLPLSLLNENFAVTTSNFVFKKSLWERLGGYQPLRYCHDLDFLLAALSLGNVSFDRDISHIDYRVHATNTIKEQIDRVRLEIANVLSDAIFSGAFKNETKSQSWLDAFQSAIANKGLSEQLMYLMSQRSLFNSKSAFYEWGITKQSDELSPKETLCGATHEKEASVSAPKTRPAGTQSSQSGNLGTVLMELQQFDRGGLEKMVLDLSIGLKQRGTDVVIVSCGQIGHLGTVASANELQVYQLPESSREQAYRDILHKHDVKIAMSHFSREGYTAFKSAGIPNITVIHNVYAMLSGEALTNFRTDDSLVSRYISVSQKATEYAVHNLGIDVAKIATVPNGLMIKEHAAQSGNAPALMRSDFGLSEDNYIFLNVASYNLHKNHYLMMSALELALMKDERIRILCLGNTIYKPHVDQLHADLASRGLEKYMLLPGYYKDVNPFFKLADAFLLPSLIEGWSVAMNEAMFAGKPMILSDTGGASEVIENEDVGILVPNEYGETPNLNSVLLDEIGYLRRHFRTAPYLAAAMTRMSQERDYWAEAGQRAKAKVSSKYNFDVMLDAYIGEMEDLASRR